VYKVKPAESQLTTKEVKPEPKIEV
jgi:hypothetical protein